MRNGFLILLALLGLAGCGDADRPLRVGVLDTIRALEEQPEVADFKLEWTEDASRMILEMESVDPKSEQFQAQFQKSAEQWEKRVNQFLESTVDKVRQDAAEVARQKGLDLVILRTPYLRSVHYFDGEDITTDVVLHLKK